MSAAVLPGQHFKTPLEKRLRIVSVKGPIVAGVYVTATGIDYRPAQEVSLSVDFVQRYCRPVSVAALAVGADA